VALLDSSGNPIADTRTDEQLLRLMAEELAAMDDEPALLALEPMTAVDIVGLLQLACRHPELSGRLRAQAGAFIDTIREHFADCPAILEVFRRGDDPHFDR